MTGEILPTAGNAISGGVFTGPVLQARHVQASFRLPAAAPVALAQLPPEAAVFTGREAEMAVLSGLLDPARPAGEVVVSAVAGLAGVGKTTLAVQAGHAAVRAGWFPGGVLFVDLHGYAQAPVEPGQALEALLRALGVPAEHIPPMAEERAGLYRSVLAQITGPVLVIADNASSEAQVRLLLPGTGRHKVLVTSRHSLAGLGARLVDLTTLDAEASTELLDEAVRAARPADRRITADPQAAARLAAACGGLPLALQIAAALLNADPALTAAELAAELASERDRLERLQYDDGSEAGGLSVAAAFELSYLRLDPESALVLRLLALNPGPDVSTAAAAALAGMATGRSRQLLARLARAHLIEAAPGGARRWRMHDLLRLYARRRCDEDTDDAVREQARDRLLGHYIGLTDAANQHVEALAGPPTSKAFTGRTYALAWLDAERPNLIAAVSMAADAGRDQVAMRLPQQLAAYLDLRRRFEEKLTITTISRNIARRLGDRTSEASALTNLGGTLALLRQLDEAITVLQDALAFYREVGDRRGEGMALGNLASTWAQMRQVDKAITTCRKVADIFRETGDRRREAMAHVNLSTWYIELDRPAEALTASEKAVAIFRETGDRRREGQALNGLGLAWSGLRQFDNAIPALREAAAIYHETGDRHGEGVAANNLGLAYREVGRLAEAITAHQDAAVIFRETRSRYNQGTALHNLGLAFAAAQRFGEAITAHQDAAAIFQETGDQYDEGTALSNLGSALQAGGRLDAAISALQSAVAVFRETGDRQHEGNALSVLGLALFQARRIRAGIPVLQDAVTIFQEISDQPGEGAARGALAMVLHAAGRTEQAISALQTAVAINRETGDRHGETMALAFLTTIRAAQETKG
jgi:tetratricopeptide (TPR) repeat protein